MGRTRTSCSGSTSCPVGFLLTMYTVTGYDASAHVAEETRDAEISAAKGVWQSVVLSAVIGWFVLLAITFAAIDVGAVNDAAAPRSRSSPRAMSEGWAETVILISAVGQFFCGMACVTSCSRTFFAFSRDRAVPGWRLWSSVNRQARAGGRRARAAACSRCSSPCPALPGNAAGVPVAFFAVVSIGVIGLYIAYVMPVYLRWRAGDDFTAGRVEPGRQVEVGQPDRGGLGRALRDHLLLPFTPGGGAVERRVRLVRGQLHAAGGGRRVHRRRAVVDRWARRTRYKGPVRDDRVRRGHGHHRGDEPTRHAAAGHRHAT